jgi:hypothetical protein
MIKIFFKEKKKNANQYFFEIFQITASKFTPISFFTG